MNVRAMIWEELMMKMAAAKAAAETATQHTTAQYIWRAQDDGHVRPEHAANNGKIFFWDNPPPTGNPGEAYGCRCWAEAIDGDDLEEFVEQRITYYDPDVSAPWDIFDFYKYYKDEARMKLGAPRSLDVLTLSQVGHMQNVLDYVSSYEQPQGGSIYNRFARDIIREARRNGGGNFLARFRNSYDLFSVSAAFRTSVIDGLSNVMVVDEGTFLSIRADVEYSFSDRYTDPYDFTYQPTGGVNEVYDDGIPYDILSSWSTRFEAVILKDSVGSAYPDGEFGEK